jgi:hypothetical protein
MLVIGAIAMAVLTSCAKAEPPASSAASSTSTSTPSGTTGVQTTTRPATATSPATVAASTGDGSRPTIVSFSITPATNAPCKDGKVLATMSWKVTPATATVTIKDLGYGFGTDNGSGEILGPFASEATDVPVPAWVSCNGKEYNLDLTATNGGAAFVGRTASVAAKAP